MSLPRGKIQGTDAEIAGTRFAAKRSSHKPYTKNFGRSPSDVRFGSKADMCSAKRHVRFTPESGHVRCNSGCPLCANSGHPKLAVALSQISDKYRRARQSDDDFGELAGLRIDVD